jgi:hypothetical protein
MAGYRPALDKCFDVSTWSGGPGGNWNLKRCRERISGMRK